MNLPKCVYELLPLLSSRGGRMLETEIPDHLRIAIPICRLANPLQNQMIERLRRLQEELSVRLEFGNAGIAVLQSAQ